MRRRGRVRWDEGQADRRRAGLSRVAAATLLAVAAALVQLVPGSAARGAAPTATVASVSEFDSAVRAFADTGGTIVLRRAAYPSLVVPPRSSRQLRIVAQRGARVGTLLLDRTQHVSIGPLRIAPMGADAWLDVGHSAHVDLHDLVVSAQGTPYSAQLLTDGARGLVIRRSEFTHCGDRSPEFVNCVLLANAPSHVTVEDNWFHDCLGCDFLHGRFGSDLKILRNRFARALPCHIGRIRCMHQDLIEMFEGQRLLVADNHFGVYERGGAQLYITRAIDHVLIENNVFIGTDRRVPGFHAKVGVIVGTRGLDRLPHYVLVTNNTILTGAPRTDGFDGSVRVASRYGGKPKRQRVIFANNVMLVLADRWPVCPASRAFVSNVIEHGVACSASDRVGDAHLDAQGRPTAASTLLIDRANPRYAPKTDITGRLRGSKPDIGAYEYHP